MLETNISLAPNRVNLPPSAWTDERVIRLKKLWQDGPDRIASGSELGGFEHCRTARAAPSSAKCIASISRNGAHRSDTRGYPGPSETNRRH
jgi:hypothetical protein